MDFLYCASFGWLFCIVCDVRKSMKEHKTGLWHNTFQPALKEPERNQKFFVQNFFCSVVLVLSGKHFCGTTNRNSNFVDWLFQAQFLFQAVVFVFFQKKLCSICRNLSNTYCSICSNCINTYCSIWNSWKLQFCWLIVTIRIFLSCFSVVQKLWFCAIFFVLLFHLEWQKFLC